MDTNQGDDAWKIFNRDTEAGRLLSRLYGVPPSGRVSYPKQRRRRRRVTDSSTKEDNRNWKTTGVVQGWNKTAEEEKEQERKTNISRALSLNVPKVGRSSSIAAAPSSIKIDMMPRRKTEMGCRDSIEEITHKQRLYRPPHLKNADVEKERLQNLTIEPHKPKPKPRDDSTTPGTLFDQIYQEILDRRKFQLEMESLGAGEDTRQTTALEIKERLEHLARLDPKRAFLVVQKLMKS